MSKSPTPQTIEDLLQDTQNANNGTERGSGLLENALRTLGAGRSILIDKDNKIIGGNQVVEGAINAGITRVRVVDTNGQELVAVRRTDVAIDSKMGRELAIADNAIALRSIDLNPDVIAKQAKTYGLDLDACGISAAELEVMLTNAKPDKVDVELEAIDASKSPPVMSWVLIGIPTVQFGSIAPQIEALAKVKDIVIESTVSSDKPDAEQEASDAKNDHD